MQPEAAQILNTFRARGLRAGSLIHPADFGDAIVWEGGFVRDEPVRVALTELFEGGYLVEHLAAFELTARGDRYLYDTDDHDLTTTPHACETHDYGARVCAPERAICRF